MTAEVRRRTGPGFQMAEIPMEAFGKARPRVTENGTYMPRGYTLARKQLKAAFGSVTVAPPWVLRVTAVRQMPASWSKKKRAAMDGRWCLIRPDVDNILGAVMDALFPEDAAVVGVSCEKQWGETHLLAIEVWSAGERPGDVDDDLYDWTSCDI